MMCHESYCRLHEALDKLIKLECSPEVKTSKYLECAIYAVEVSIAAALDADKSEVA